MTTYYVRHDGTQTNKANAVIGGAAAFALSVAGFNAESFSPGDEIIFERSGAYTSVIQINDSGVEGNPIIYRGPGALEEQHAQIRVAGQNGISITGNYIHVKNFSIWATSDKCIFIAAASGNAGDGMTIKVFDCIAQANSNGDGFGTNSVASDTSEVEWIRCEARAVVGTNNQGFTNHVDQHMILTDCKTTPECETAMVMVGASCIVNGGEFHAFGTVIQAGQNCNTTVNDAILVAGYASTARLFSVDTDLTAIIFNDCTLKHLAPSTTNNSLVNNTVSVTINGGTFETSAAPTALIEWATSGANGGVFRMNGVHLIIREMGARFLRTNTAGGAVEITGCIIDLSNVTGSGVQIAFEIRNTSNGLRSIFANNLCIGNQLTSFVFLRMLDACVSPVDIYNNTFVAFNGVTSDVISAQQTSQTNAVRVRNNIFADCLDALQTVAGTFSFTKDYNVYCLGTADESDTNGLISDPLFVDFANGDYRLTQNSPCRESGFGVVAPFDADGKRFKNPPSRGCFEFNAGIRPAA